MSNAFFIDPNNLRGKSFRLDAKESHHVSKVFRLGPGNMISLLDGEGFGYHGIIEKEEDGIISGRIEKAIEHLGENKNSVIIAPALLKRDRFEFLIEKATELGVKEIQPLLTQRCIKRSINIERCRKIILSSSKQCQRSDFPIIYEPMEIIGWLSKPKKQCFAGMIGAEDRLTNFNYNKKTPVSILIGPEGDFSNKELEQMDIAGVKLFSLGNRRLRAETAAQASLSILNELLV